MKYLLNVLLLTFILLFTSCSSKNEIDINKNIKSFSLDKNITIIRPAKTISSPISVGLGVGGQIARFVGIGIGTSIRPSISNDKALVLQKSLALHNVSLSNLIKDEFTSLMTNDEIYKDKFVSFGSEYTIHLLVAKSIIQTPVFSSKAQIQMQIQVQILNRNGETVYDDIAENSLEDENYIYKKSMILNNAKILETSVLKAVNLTLAQLIKQMKKN